jgi:alginate O-acetyltransferase complex protein AlgI
MLFNSSIFFVFFIITYTLYLLTHKNLRLQNTVLLFASLLFYGYADWSILPIFIISIVVNYIFGFQIQRTEGQRQKRTLLLSLIFNLSILGFFKYFNFFIESIYEAFNLVGLIDNRHDWVTLNVLLPIGISFFTFQLISYNVDIFQKKIPHLSNFFDFALFISFFPQLVAGPIERATDLLPQVISKRVIKPAQVYAGIHLIIWGFFKKVVIADNLSRIADEIFNNYPQYQGLDLVVGFTLQIYGDFSGYSDIARGLGQLMGFNLTLNFRLPYFATSPSDFWNRWHISLSSWLRDYLYIPLGGNRHGEFKTYRNLFLTMLLGGLWHGAAWNFVLWGAYQGVILILYRIFDPPSKQKQELPQPNRARHRMGLVVKIGLMFLLTNIGWVIFRSNSVEQIGYILTNVGFSVSSETAGFWRTFTLISLPLVIIQTCQNFSKNLLIFLKMPEFCLTLAHAWLIIWILIFGVRQSGEFIYFQF